MKNRFLFITRVVVALQAVFCVEISAAFTLYSAAKDGKQITLLAALHAWPNNISSLQKISDLRADIALADGLVFETNFWEQTPGIEINSILSEQMAGHRLDQGVLSEAAIKNIKFLVRKLPEERQLPWKTLNTFHPYIHFISLSCENTKETQSYAKGFDFEIHVMAKSLGKSIYFTQDGASQFRSFVNSDVHRWSQVFEDSINRFSCQDEKDSTPLESLASLYIAGDDVAAFKMAVTDSPLPWMATYVESANNTQAAYLLNLNSSVNRIFAVIGWSHLIGNNSVISILQRYGYEVQRCKETCVSLTGNSRISR
ncbi:TraB/GumN family protein [Paucibacter sp. KCTC 42545]|uniref:TraB/GumN family protein n=1 Tax=Paucibacter sp. KCTC 42545 TaxID=1768242 RepID=UPI0009E88FA1|nr:TraB/GumN family protein [Paucibacter sp. KCTC 42545]